MRGGKKSSRSWRGTQSWRGKSRGNTSNNPANAPPPDWPNPQKDAIDKIDLQTLLMETTTPIIGDVEYVASYSWQNGYSPKIYVPGSPPAWSPPAKDPKLEEDHEDVFRDINAARYPHFPMEPAILSVFYMQPTFDMQEIDVVGCGNTLGNLLRFSGSVDSRRFRFDVDVVGETVFFVRKGESPREMITDIRGYGQIFPKKYTTLDAEVKNSCSHQRLIQYSFGGLQFLVRTETDGYVRNDPSVGKDSHTKVEPAIKEDHATKKTPDEKEEPNVKLPPNPSAPASPSSLEKIESKLNETSLETPTTPESYKIDLQPAGTPVSQDQIFDIKTRYIKNVLNMSEIYPRLWVNQTSKFLIAYNSLGFFDNPQVKDVRQEVLAWQRENAALLARYHGLVQRIIQVALNSECQQLEVRWDGQGPLCVYERPDGIRVLSQKLLDRVELYSGQTIDHLLYV